MGGFSLQFRASRVSVGALAFVVLVLVGAIGLVVTASGAQQGPMRESEVLVSGSVVSGATEPQLAQLARC
jgi:hypothetical protein